MAAEGRLYPGVYPEEMERAYPEITEAALTTRAFVSGCIVKQTHLCSRLPVSWFVRSIAWNPFEGATGDTAGECLYIHETSKWPRRLNHDLRNRS
jgi:hypothetical protein